jgi:hypothetical protein
MKLYSKHKLIILAIISLYWIFWLLSVRTNA